MKALEGGVVSMNSKSTAAGDGVTAAMGGRAATSPGWIQTPGLPFHDGLYSGIVFQEIFSPLSCFCQGFYHRNKKSN